MTLLPVVPAFVLGFLFIHLVTRKTNLPNQIFFSISLSCAAGLAIISLILFWSFALFGAYGKTIGIAGVYTTIGVLINEFIRRGAIHCAHPKRGRDESRPYKRLTSVLAFLFFLFCLYRFLDYYINYNALNIYGGWDAHYMWNIKARFYTRLPEAWIDQFHHPKPLWTLPDYPHLLPASVAWGWLSAGKETLVWPPFVGLIFFLSMCAVLIWYLASYQNLGSAFLAGSFLITIPAYRFWAGTQYADIPLAFFITTAGVLLVAAMRHNQNRLFFLSAMFAGFAAWTKNEGVMFCFVLSIFFLGYLLRKKTFQNLTQWFLGLLMPLVSVFYIKIFLGGSGIYLNATRTAQDYIALMTDSTRTLLIGASFGVLLTSQEQWVWLWLFFLAALIYSVILSAAKNLDSKKSYSWVLAGIVIALEAAYFLIYQVSPLELQSHIKWSLVRLLLHTGVLAIIFSFETLNRPQIDA